MTRRALAEREFRRKAARRQRWRRSSVVLTASVLTLAALLLIVADRLFRPGAFPIEQVRLEGEFKQVDPERLRARIVEALGDNFFALDLLEIERAVEDMPWVHHARVRRYWPRGLAVKIVEQRLVARWGGQQWLNRSGEVVMVPDDAGIAGLPRLLGPPHSGPLVLRHYREWLPRLREVGLELSALTLSSRYAWEMTLTAAGGGEGESFALLLGREDVAARLQRFLRFYPAKLSADAAQVISVDLRYPNGLAVQWAPKQQNDDNAV